jgi:LysR family carnitine catabolism transcriptional activator
MMDLNIRKLRSFVLVAEVGSFRRAAERLHISPSALSTHIREIEESFGVPLLQRTTRSVRLTAEGKRFLGRAKELMSGLDEMVEELRSAASLQRGRLTIACVPTLTENLLPRAMAVLAQKHPAISLRIVDRGARQIARHIEDGEADLGVVSPPENGRDFDITLLGEDPMVVVVPRDHPFALRREIRFAELASWPYIALKSSTSVSSAVARGAREAGITLSPIFELVNHYSACGLVQAGLGITILPAMTAPTAAMTGLVPVPLVAPRVARRVGIIRRKGEVLSPAAEQFLAVLRATVGEFAEATRPRTADVEARRRVSARG